MKISSPNFTQEPTPLIDEWLPRLNKDECIILCKISQKSICSNENSIELDLTEFIKSNQLSGKQIKNACRSLANKGLITIK